MIRIFKLLYNMESRIGVMQDIVYDSEFQLYTRRKLPQGFVIGDFHPVGNISGKEGAAHGDRFAANEARPIVAK